LDNVWPAVLAKFPNASFHIAGKNTPDWLSRRAGESVIVLGEVDDAKKFINSHPIMVAPLFSGSGIKIKVLEGMAMSRVVITTPVGSEGIPARSQEHLLVAKTAEQFIRQIDFCLKNPGLLWEMGRKARHFIQMNFDNFTIGGKVYRAYEKKLAQMRSKQEGGQKIQ
jgi:polysaccharide biosynthesis protein PslH